MRRIILGLVVLSVCLGGIVNVAGAGHRFGGGLHYLRTVGEIEESPQWDADAIGILASYQFARRLFIAEFDVEWVPNYGGQDESMIEPQGWLLLGGLIYGGGGIGIGYFNNEWQHNPFYALRLGVNLRLGTLNGDLFATYRFQSAEQIEGFNSSDLDTITLGAVVRFGK